MAVVGLAVGLLTGGCSPATGPTTDPRAYSVVLTQWQRTEGLEATIERRLTVTATVVETSSERGRYDLVVREIRAEGDGEQAEMVRRLSGHRVVVGPRQNQVSLGTWQLDESGIPQAADALLLFQAMVSSQPDVTPPRSVTLRLAGARTPLELSLADTPKGRERFADRSTRRIEGTGRSSISLPPSVAYRPAPDGGSNVVAQPEFTKRFGGAPAHPFVTEVPSNIGFVVGCGFTFFVCLFGPPPDRTPKVLRPAEVLDVELRGSLTLKSSKVLLASDARLLSGFASGTMTLRDHLPRGSSIPQALKGKSVSMTSEWAYSQTLVSPLPSRGPSPVHFAIALALLALVVLALTITALRTLVR